MTLAVGVDLERFVLSKVSTTKELSVLWVLRVVEPLLPDQEFVPLLPRFVVVKDMPAEESL